MAKQEIQDVSVCRLPDSGVAGPTSAASPAERPRVDQAALGSQWRAALLSQLAVVMFALGLAALPWPELLAGGSTRVILTFAGQLLLVPALLKRLPFRLRAVSLTLALLLFLSPAVVVAPGFNVLMTAGTAVLMSRIFLGARGMAAVGGMVALMLALTWQRTDLAGAAGQQMQWSNLSAFMAGVSTMCWVVLTTFDRIAEARARTRRLLDDVHDERRSRDWMLRQAEAAEDRERRQQAESLLRLVGAELSRAKAAVESAMRTIDVHTAALTLAPAIGAVDMIVGHVERLAARLRSGVRSTEAGGGPFDDHTPPPLVREPSLSTAAADTWRNALFVLAARSALLGIVLALILVVVSWPWHPSSALRVQLLIAAAVLVIPAALGGSLQGLVRCGVCGALMLLAVGDIHAGYLPVAGGLMAASVLLASLSGSWRSVAAAMLVVLAVMIEALSRGTVLTMPFSARAAALDPVRWWGSLVLAVFAFGGVLIGIHRALQQFDREHAEEHRLLEGHRQGLAQRRAVATRLATASAAERRRIGRELEDELLPRLRRLRTSLSLADHRGTPAAIAASLAATLDSFDEARSRVATIAGDIRPRALQELGGIAAIRQLVELDCARTGLLTDIYLELDGQSMAADVELVAYDVVKDAVAAIREASGASRVSLAIVALAEGLAFTIVGDGSHPDLDRGRVSPFAAAEDRLAAIGSALSISREQGGGASISFVVPARAAA